MFQSHKTESICQMLPLDWTLSDTQHCAIQTHVHVHNVLTTITCLLVILIINT